MPSHAACSASHTEPDRKTLDGYPNAKVMTAIRSRIRRSSHGKLLVAPQYHLLHHQPLENVFGLDCFFRAEDR